MSQERAEESLIPEPERERQWIHGLLDEIEGSQRPLTQPEKERLLQYIEQVHTVRITNPEAGPREKRELRELFDRLDKFIPDILDARK